MTEKNCTELIHCQSEVSISCIHFKSSEKTQTNTQKNRAVKHEPASTLRKIPQTVMLILIPQKFLPTSKRKIIKATEILEKITKLVKSLKFYFINIHLVDKCYNCIHTNTRIYKCTIWAFK